MNVAAPPASIANRSWARRALMGGPPPGPELLGDLAGVRHAAMSFTSSVD